jgi:hypothetical protein
MPIVLGIRLAAAAVFAFPGRATWPGAGRDAGL